MNCHGEENPCCYLHPSEVIVGVCALCLKERLLILAAKQGHHIPLPKDTHRSFTVIRRKPTITLPRVFSLRPFLQRLETRPQEDGQDDSGESSMASLEDSFISIKFEDNGRASWDKSYSVERLEASSKAAGSNQEGEAKEGNGGRSLVEHSKPMGSLRWGKKIGHLLQMLHWKRSSMAAISHIGLTGKVEAAKGRRSWIRSLTWMTTTTTSTTD